MNTPFQNFVEIIQSSTEEEARAWLKKNLHRFSPIVRPQISCIFEEYAHEKRFNPKEEEEDDANFLKDFVKSLSKEEFERLILDGIKKQKT